MNDNSSIEIDENPEEKAQDNPEQESLLLSLWRKFKKGRSKEPQEDASSQTESTPPDQQPSEQESLTPKEIPFEKTTPPEALVSLYKKWCQAEAVSAQERAYIEDFCQSPLPESSVLEHIFFQIEKECEAYLKQYDKLVQENKALLDSYLSALTQAKETEDASQHSSSASLANTIDVTTLDVAPPMDARLFIFNAPDWSCAWCMVFPPFGSGASVTSEALMGALAQKGIVYGLLEQNILDAVKKEHFLTLIPVAQGLAPVPGVDGEVVEHYPQTVGTPHLLENERGIVDFDNLNYLTHIDADTVICDLIAPIAGTPGIDVRSKPIKTYNGKKPPYPMGQNVVVNESGTALVSKIDGQISFREGRFHVSNCIHIQGDVDLSTGSLDVRGDLIIDGNVLSGFTVRATGDITIGGIVEGSQITAGGTIIVNRGMNGNMVGTLIAGRDIYCKYMENSTVQADGDIYMDSCVNCEVSSIGRVIVTSGRGIIIGGSIVSMHGIEAKIIGNKAGRITTLSISATSYFCRNKTSLENELADVTHQLNIMQNTLMGSTDSLNLKILQMKQRKIKEDLNTMCEKIDQLKQGQIFAQTLYPLANVCICGVCTTIAESWSPCRIYLDGKERQIRISQ